ncbi:sensor histidine kinase [Micromonospora auratinigra]|nr:sensor histidine kinase [Micromonospora auratinigra]
MEVVAPRTRPAARRARTVLSWAGVALLPVTVLLSSVAGGGGPVLTVPTPDHTVPALPLNYLLPVLVVLLPVGLLGRHPLPALGAMLAGACAVTVTTSAWEDGYLVTVWYLQFLVVDLMLGLVVARHPRRVALPAAAAVLAVQVAMSFVSPATEPVDRATLSALAVAVAWLAGDSVHGRRRHRAAARYRAAADAVTAERLRIARELHDVVAHSIGVIAIQAGVGARVIDTQPAQARAALATIERTSRETLTGLRRTLVALRRPEGAAASLTPAPGLADLDRLVAAATDAGVRVELRRDGVPGPLPAEVDLAAYRIVQEGLTNVVRHAGTDRCRVTVDHRPDGVRIEVLDGGRGGSLTAAGHGIVGMRERATLLGGRFAAAPRPEGGFRVTAWLPVPAADG